MDKEDLVKKETENTADNFGSNYQDYTDAYQNSYDADAEPEKTSNTNSVISLIMGILSLVFCCCSVLGIIPAIVGIIMANKAKKNGETGGAATAGLVCSIIGLVFGIIVTLFYVIYGVAVFALINEWKNSGILDQIQYMDESEISELIMQYQFGN